MVGVPQPGTMKLGQKYTNVSKPKALSLRPKTAVKKVKAKKTAIGRGKK